jgi:hypothetical protein
VWDPLHVAYKWQIIAVLVISEAAAIVSASGVLAADYEDLKAHQLNDEYLTAHHLAKQFLPGPTKTLSDLLSWLTTIGLAAGFIAVVVVALRPRRNPRPA